jgi:hypothetical protein
MTLRTRIAASTAGRPGQPGTAAREWSWLAPFAGALCYPFLLAQLHRYATAGFGAWASLLLTLVCLIPAAGLLNIYRLGKRPQPGARSVLARRLSHLVVATPPLFTLLGVVLYLMKIDGIDGVVWIGPWAAAAMLGILLTSVSAPGPAALHDERAHRRLRAIHGIVSLVLLLVFLGPHMFNHLAGWWGIEAHRAIMRTLRVMYRQGLLEPLIITAFFFQILSGLVLLRRSSAATGDALGALQTASGIYLAVFIAAHINSVFTLARYFGSETDYAWAVGAPAGLLADRWSIRLLPHYALAVFFLIAHLACGARLVMRSHGVAQCRADAIGWTLVGLGLVLSAAIVAAMLGARINGQA